jgi:acetyl-CoA carboxylase biotin carboxyl carrier protein
VNLLDLKEILQILEERDITEFEMEQGGVKLRVCRGAGRVPALAQAPVVVTQIPAGVPVTAAVANALPPQPASAEAPAAPAPAAPAGEPAAPEGTLVRSPIVGTFYRSPDPNSPAFVSVGDTVKVGQVLCIIEAMKLMNEIESELAGEVVKVYPENGQPVQYGDALFTIRPA